MIITIAKTKTGISRTFTIEGELLTTVLKYQALRPAKVTTEHFFIKYTNGKCINQNIGINTIRTLPKKIATFLKLPDPECYTGHSFRRTSTTFVADSGADITQIKRHGGWKSTSTAEGYIEESVGQKRKTGQLISSAIGLSNFEKIELKKSKTDNQVAAVPSSSKSPSKQLPLSTADLNASESPLKEISIPKNSTLNLSFTNCSNMHINFK